MFGSLGHVPVSAVEFLTSATLPEPAAIAIVPVASGEDNAAPLLPPELSWIREYCPGCRFTPGHFVTDPGGDVALAYCTDQPLRLTAVLPALKISMKSLRSAAPAFPPPPKTWLITMPGEDEGLGDGVGLGVGVGVGVGAVPAITTDVGLLCTPSALATTVHLPAPRNSAGTNTWISSSPRRSAGATVSTALCSPQIVTETLLARTTPVAKIDNRN